MSKTQHDVGALLPGVGVFGGVRRFLEIGNELVARGHRFTLYHPTGEPPSWLTFLGRTRRLDQLPESRHEFLICSDPVLLSYFKDARAGTKFFYVVLEKLDNESAIMRSKNWRLLANSTGILERIRRRYRIEAHPVIGGVDPRVFHPGVGRTTRHLEDCSPAQPFRILTYGRLSRKRKGTRLVVGAVEKAARRLGKSIRAADIELVLFDHVGPGNEADPRDGFQSTVAHRFCLNPSQAELAELYRSSDLFVNAERRAGWNNTVAEAMSCGLPVVCTTSGTRDLARHDETAHVVRWRWAPAFAAGIVDLSRDAGKRGRLAAAARRRVQAFTWPRVTDAFEDALRCV